MSSLTHNTAGGEWERKVRPTKIKSISFSRCWTLTPAGLLLPEPSTECPSWSTRSHLSRLLLPTHETPEHRPWGPSSLPPWGALQRLHHSRVLCQRGGFLHPCPCESSRSVILAETQPQPRGWGWWVCFWKRTRRSGDVLLPWPFRAQATSTG